MDDDQDDLLQCTDDESLSETDDQCMPVDNKPEDYRHTLHFFTHTKLEFLVTKLFLVFSTTLILIFLPLYLETVNVRGDAYSLVLVSSTASVLGLALIIAIGKYVFGKFKQINVARLPLDLWKLLRLAVFYVISGFMIVYALDRKRVLCHLQDPIKGVVLVFSLLYYFFFCRKLMGLQRIFSATTIIVGLFIAVDYGLCDEFRCRGYERQQLIDDTGNWTWQIHSIWTAIYIIGISLFSAFFTILERHILINNNETESNTISVVSPFLSTVSRSVSHPNNTNNQTRNLITRQNGHKIFSSLHLAFWLHVFCWIVVVALFWTDLIPEIGKTSGALQFFNHTTGSILCHFTLPSFEKLPYCGNVAIYSWLFICSYILFIIIAIKFLILSQSAVYTIATMTAALPLIGIWWSLFHMTPIENGLLLWSPSVTGELICSLLGLPIILIGLCLLCKSHFKDYEWSKLVTSAGISSNHLT